MKIYLDILIISNVMITLVFIKTVSAIVHTRLRRKNRLLCLIPAAISSLLIILRPENYFESLLITLIKLIASALIVKLAFGLKLEKRLLTYTAAYIAVNIAFGGICMLLWELFGADFIHTGNLTVYFNVPLWLLIMCVAAVYGFITLYEKLMFISSARAESYRAVFVYGDFTAELPAVSDTGNRLIDSFSGEPVVIFSCDRIYYHFDLDNAGSYPVSGFYLIPCSTVAGSSLMPVTLKGKITIHSGSGESKELRCAAGITKSHGKDRAIFDPRLLL